MIYTLSRPCRIGFILLFAILSLSCVNFVKAMEGKQEPSMVNKMVHGFVKRIPKLIAGSVGAALLLLLLIKGMNSHSVTRIIKSGECADLGKQLDDIFASLTSNENRLEAERRILDIMKKCLPCEDLTSMKKWLAEIGLPLLKAFASRKDILTWELFRCSKYVGSVAECSSIVGHCRNLSAWSGLLNILPEGLYDMIGDRWTDVMQFASLKLIGDLRTLCYKVMPECCGETLSH